MRTAPERARDPGLRRGIWGDSAAGEIVRQPAAAVVDYARVPESVADGDQPISLVYGQEAPTAYVPVLR